VVSKPEKKSLRGNKKNSRKCQGGHEKSSREEEKPGWRTCLDRSEGEKETIQRRKVGLVFCLKVTTMRAMGGMNLLRSFSRTNCVLCGVCYRKKYRGLDLSSVRHGRKLVLILS